jgi:hypothetical protein
LMPVPKWFWTIKRALDMYLPSRCLCHDSTLALFICMRHSEIYHGAMAKDRRADDGAALFPR